MLFFGRENLQHVTVALKVDEILRNFIHMLREKSAWKLTCGADFKSTACPFLLRIGCGISPMGSQNTWQIHNEFFCCGFWIHWIFILFHLIHRNKSERFVAVGLLAEIEDFLPRTIRSISTPCAGPPRVCAHDWFGTRNSASIWFSSTFHSFEWKIRSVDYIVNKAVDFKSATWGKKRSDM